MAHAGKSDYVSSQVPESVAEARKLKAELNTVSAQDDASSVEVYGVLAVALRSRARFDWA